MTYNEHGKRIRSENLAGRIATKVAQGEGGLGLRTDMAYTVKHIQKSQTRMPLMKFFVERSHLVCSVIVWIVLKYLHSGRWSSFRYSSTTCLVVCVLGLILFFATFLQNLRLSLGFSFRRIPYLILIGFLDFAVLLNAALSLETCIRARGSREFWGEGREIDGGDKYEMSEGGVSLSSNQGQIILYDVKLSSPNPPGSLKPYRCTGRINALVEGHLFARIVDPETKRVLSRSEKHEVKRSLILDDKAFFDLPCNMFLGRKDKQYIVRCELWFLSHGGAREEKIAEILVKIKGWF